MKKACASVLDAIGSTPMVRLQRLSPASGGTVFAKLEYMNPGGSIKDRAALGMVEDAERAGLLKPGDTIVEPTAGNTGVGLALVAAARGYKMIVVIPEGYSREKMSVMRGLGAELVVTPKDKGMPHAIQVAEDLVKGKPGFYCPQQFRNPSNPDYHQATTGREIWEQMDGKVDAVVLGAGTGGTFTGVVRCLREKNPALKAILVEPQGSVFAGGKPGPHKVEGIGNSFIPATLDLSLADQIVMINDERAYATVNELGRREGLLCGGSSGANCRAALDLAEKSAPGTRIVTIFPDSAERYLSKHDFNGGP